MRSQSGRTLAEVLVALLLSVLVGLALVGLQMSANRWYRSDQQAVVPLGPMRNALDHIARDLRTAGHAECCSGGKLILHQRHETHLYQITYWLDGDQLKRSVMTNYDPTLVTERTLVRGLKSFTPALSGEKVLIALEAESTGPDGVVRRIETELVPRLGVMP